MTTNKYSQKSFIISTRLYQVWICVIPDAIETWAETIN